MDTTAYQILRILKTIGTNGAFCSVSMSGVKTIV